MSMEDLTSGCLKTIMSGTEFTGEPILQVLGSKRITGGTAERYRVLLSDGQYLQSFSMLSTQLNHLVTNGELSEFTIIQVKNHITSLVNKNDQDESKRVLIIVALEILKKGETVGHKIGDPISLSEVNKPNAPTQATPAPSVQPLKNSNSNYTQRPQTQSSSANDSMMSFDGRATHPISALSPYQNKWVIKARVTAKSPIRTWSNAKGEGKLFSMDLMDESGQIRVTGFRDSVDKFYEMIEVDKVYFITKAQIKPANKQFSNLPHDYELTLGNDSAIQECTEVNDIPKVSYDFVPISQLSDKENNAVVDIIGICDQVGDLQTFTAKTSNRELKKREITMVDNSNSSVTVVLWGQDAEKFQDFGQPVLLIKAGRINEFNGGKTVSMISSSVLKRNPDLVEGHRLRGWFDNGGASGIQKNLSARGQGAGNFSTEWLSFEEAKVKNLGQGDKPDYYQLKATIHMIRNTNAVYKACPQQECNKKVIDLEHGQYRCEKCNMSFPNFKYRLMVSMNIGDWTSNRWITCFANEAEQVLGKTSEEIGRMMDENKEEADAYLQAQHFRSFLFKLRTKVEFYGDSSRNKITAQSITPVNHKDYNDFLVKNIEKLTGISKR